MEITIGTIIMGIIPVATKFVKKLFKTAEIKQEETRKLVNNLIPIFLGILSNGLYAISLGADWRLSLAIGVGSGLGASKVRDMDKQFGITRAIINRQKKG